MKSPKKIHVQNGASNTVKPPQKAAPVSVSCEQVPVELLRKYSSSKPLASYKRADDGK